jgi:hypothetical protein
MRLRQCSYALVGFEGVDMAVAGTRTEPGAAFKITEVGKEVPDAEVEVTIGPQFLELFSEQLYTSPNKAFEELVSNSWDAGATNIHVGMSSKLAHPTAAAWVLDDGESMDIEGFKLLWTVAQSAKSARKGGRPQIGKFGIGKLATYVLAHQLTYICRAADGVIRAVTMDYRWIGRNKGRLHIDPLPLPVRELDDEDVDALLRELAEGERILADLTKVRAGVRLGRRREAEEFGGASDSSEVSGSTWTLAIMTSLKPPGQGMQSGRIRRMLMTSLPLGSSVGISYNGEDLPPTKSEITEARQWRIGPDLDIKELRIAEDEVVDVEAHDTPYPHLKIDGIGEVTGTVTLYEDSIAGGRSLELGRSNGFFVNILGRVVNAQDPYFGLKNLNHAAWAKFRAAIRADGLNPQLAVSRESVLEARQVTAFRALLRAIFNVCRLEYDRAAKAAWPDAGDILTEAWGTVPLEPLQRAIEDGLTSGELPTFILGSEHEVSPERLDRWNDVATPADVIQDISFAPLGADAGLVAYDMDERRILINENHPFTREHATTHEQQLLLRDMALVELLTRAYMAGAGVDEAIINQVDLYRDQLYRLVARLRRTSGFQIAELLDAASYHPKSKAFETILGDALESLGYVVERIGGSGNPEGVATAPITVGRREGSYSFTFDAKSSINRKVKAKDASTGGLNRHRIDHNADHVLLVGPSFTDGALQQECEQQKITPMLASDLGVLVVLNATRGPIDLKDLRPMFGLYNENAVHDFIEQLAERLAANQSLSYSELLAALGEIGFGGPDMLTTPVIAKEIRDRRGNPTSPTKEDVAAVLHGLSILAPNLVRVKHDNVFLGARPDKLREVVLQQIRALPAEYQFGAAGSA